MPLFLFLPSRVKMGRTVSHMTMVIKGEAVTATVQSNRTDVENRDSLLTKSLETKLGRRDPDNGVMKSSWKRLTGRSQMIIKEDVRRMVA